MWNCVKGRLLAWEPSGIQGFIASCQFKAIDLLVRPRVVMGFVHLPGGIICSPRRGEASLHLDPECTDLVPRVIHQSFCSSVDFPVLNNGYCHLLLCAWFLTFAME